MSHWRYPPPRPGLAGALDRFIGPGATAAEIWLQLVAAVAGAVLAVVWGFAEGRDWSALQLVVAGLLGFDMAGGVVTNATAAAKRWYHRQGQGKREHLTFTLVHVAHLVVVAWLFRDGGWNWLAINAVFLTLAAMLIVSVPLYLQRPVAMFLYAGSLVIGLVVLRPTPGLEWFLPFFYLKLLVSHLVHEEPYPPEAPDDGPA